MPNVLFFYSHFFFCFFKKSVLFKNNNYETFKIFFKNFQNNIERG